MALLKKVAIDTNMLTAMLEFKIDVFDEIAKKLGNIEFGFGANHRRTRKNKKHERQGKEKSSICT